MIHMVAFFREKISLTVANIWLYIAVSPFKKAGEPIHLPSDICAGHTYPVTGANDLSILMEPWPMFVKAYAKGFSVGYIMPFG